MAFNKDRYLGDVSEEQLEELFHEASQHGAILSDLFFDAHGPSKDGVQNSLVDFVSKLTKEPGILYCKGEIQDAIESNDESALNQNVKYSCSTRVRVLTESFNTLLGLCLRYGPLAVEIQRPHDIHLNLDEAQNLLLDASSMTQDYVQYIMTKTMSQEEKDKLQEHLKKRAEIAAKIRKNLEHASE
ncbi:hypothetical protein HY572_02120 [Candidatus Micrarchaeota archaeon]|nr:hypothetical protein [Candidatus Micrarchaeota archaeon]